MSRIILQSSIVFFRYFRYAGHSAVWATYVIGRKIQALSDPGSKDISYSLEEVP
jgi:hypothetical protein